MLEAPARFAVIFAVFSAACLAGASLKHGSYWWLWPSFAYASVSISYAGVGPRIYGKRSDGSLPFLRMLLYAPYLLPTWAIWFCRCWVDARTPADLVAPGVWLGRRPFRSEIPPGVKLLLDFTAEFPGCGVPSDVQYNCFPTLDYTAPRIDDIRKALQQIGDRAVYIHCAAGHGRSAVCAAVLLIHRGLANNVDEAISQLRVVRPGVKLTRQQHEAVMNVQGQFCPVVESRPSAQ